MPGDIGQGPHRRALVERAVAEMGGLDILVNNAAHQASFQDISHISDEEWEATFRTNLHAMFHLAKATLPHLKAGSAIINTASINADSPNPSTLPPDAGASFGSSDGPEDARDAATSA